MAKITWSYDKARGNHVPQVTVGLEWSEEEKGLKVELNSLPCVGGFSIVQWIAEPSASGFRGTVEQFRTQVQWFANELREQIRKAKASQAVHESGSVTVEVL